MNGYDAIVIGLGAMGSAVAHRLARRGAHVLGLEQFTETHDRGSSHGQTRIIRKAYFEHPDYVPLLDRAYMLWSELEQECGTTLFERCGLLLAGPPDGTVIAGCREAIARHRLAIEPIEVADVVTRFPAFRLDEGMHALFERDAGFLHVEACVLAQARAAARQGADLRYGEPVVGWSAAGDGVRVRTADGEYAAQRLVICGGAWSSRLLAALRLPLEVRRKVMLWLPATDDRLRLDRGCPVFGFDSPQGFVYGFPQFVNGELKVANHTGGETVEDADAPDRSLREADLAFLPDFVARYVYGVEARALRHAICMYTMTPDEHFFLDRVPEMPQVLFAAGFSGHGFKFAPVVGEALAQLALDGATDAPIGFLAANPERTA